MNIARVKSAKKSSEGFYITCKFCGSYIKGSTEAEVIKKANEKGWVYDSESDEYYCRMCIHEQFLLIRNEYIEKEAKNFFNKINK